MEARKALLIVDALYRSTELGRRVKLGSPTGITQVVREQRKLRSCREDRFDIGDNGAAQAWSFLSCAMMGARS
jgi:hypothetical protein